MKTFKQVSKQEFLAFKATFPRLAATGSGSPDGSMVSLFYEIKPTGEKIIQAKFKAGEEEVYLIRIAPDPVERFTLSHMRAIFDRTSSIDQSTQDGKMMADIYFDVLITEIDKKG